MKISLNIPVPGEIQRLAADLEPDLYTFERVRRRYTFLVKRFGERTPAEYARLAPRVRRALADTPPFEVRAGGIETFEKPTHGTDSVVYLAVESPELFALHDRLCAAFEPVEEIEGDGYTPHVTLARGGTPDQRERLRGMAIEPVEWTVNELVLWDGVHGEVTTRFSLPV